MNLNKRVDPNGFKRVSVVIFFLNSEMNYTDLISCHTANSEDQSPKE